MDLLRTRRLNTIDLFMGNSGVRKLFLQGENVETQYTSLYSIPIVTIDKQEIDL
jgi:hypothetical protein